MPTELCLCVADCQMVITADAHCRSWEAIKYRYMPFAADSSSDKGLSIHIGRGVYAPLSATELCNLMPKGVDDIELRILMDTDRAYIIEVRHPRCSAYNGWLLIDPSLSHAEIRIDETGDVAVDSITCNICIMMAYMLYSAPRGVALIHASCVTVDGRAYMFTGRSGTGKSTHSRLWIANIPGAVLLNDDHPIVRLSDDGSVMAYGSPWSGKTDCYLNHSAPLAAIVRLRQAPSNEIRRVADIEAFASLFSSFSYLPCIEVSDEHRRRIAVELASRIPHYIMDCLPDADAALMSYLTIK